MGHAAEAREVSFQVEVLIYVVASCWVGKLRLVGMPWCSSASVLIAVGVSAYLCSGSKGQLEGDAVKARKQAGRLD